MMPCVRSKASNASAAWASRSAGMLNTMGASAVALASGAAVSDILFYYVFGTFKLAVIAQQIYARFVKGYTRDKRFAAFNHFVSALGVIAADSIRRGKI